ncbi:MAG: hypothetical protein HYR89_09380 [Actinobacteria bacterium]|nr:hypothetical protein [Actinomycetota bacterium]
MPTDPSQPNGRAEPVAAAVAHLHSATRSMIAAARAFLDAAEALVETPGIFATESAPQRDRDEEDS